MSDMAHDFNTTDELARFCALPQRLFGVFGWYPGRFLIFWRTYPVDAGSRMPYSERNLAPLRILEAIAARP